MPSARKPESLGHELDIRVKRYRELTAKALEVVEIAEGLSEKEKRMANDFLEMARNYFSDAQHFESEKKLLLALAAYSYAHAWLDAGVRAKVFFATDDQLFTLP